MSLMHLTVGTIPDLEAPIRYLEEPVGSGKTGLVVDEIRIRDQESHLFVAPTIALAKEVEKRLRSSGVPNVHLIYSDSSGSVTSRLNKLLLDRLPEVSQVVVITSAAFRDLLETIPPVIARHYHVYLDEGLEAVTYLQFKADHFHQYGDLLGFDESGYLKPASGCIQLLSQVAKRDDNIRKLGRENLLTPGFRSIAKYVSSDLYDVRARLTGKSVSIVAMLNPQRLQHFRSVTMVAAEWSQSIVAMAWKSAYGVTIEPFKHDKPLFNTHLEKGPSLSIYYCLHPDDKATVENLNRDYLTGEKSPHVAASRRVISQIGQAVQCFFEHRRLTYCWNANKDHKSLARIMTGRQMPAKPSGLNEFENYDNVAALGCNNPPSWVKDLLIGFLRIETTDSDAVDALYRQWRFDHTYQSVGRCSLRKREHKAKNIAVVLSLQCAQDLHRLFEGSTIQGCLTDLPSFKQMDGVTRSTTRHVYDASDNKAWSLWRKRHTDQEIEKGDWFQTIRRFKKASRLETVT